MSLEGTVFQYDADGEVGEVSRREFGRRLRPSMRLKAVYARLEVTWSWRRGRGRLVECGMYCREQNPKEEM